MFRIALKTAATATVLVVALAAVSGGASAQSRHHISREPKQTERPAPAASVDKRDSVATAPPAFSGRPYWLALAQCGGIYFKLNTLYTTVAVQARVVKPDPTLNSQYTTKLNEAIRTATVYFAAAERFLMNDRGLERIDAVLIYDDQSRAAGDRVKTIDAALSAAKACPALYEACQAAYPKACGDPLPPVG